VGLPLEDFADASLADVAGAREFIERARFDAVLSGHAHGGYRFTVGRVPVFGAARRDGYDLLTLGAGRVRCETVQVRGAHPA
jgi:hypothetical protein